MSTAIEHGLGGATRSPFSSRGVGGTNLRTNEDESRAGRSNTRASSVATSTDDDIWGMANASAASPADQLDFDWSGPALNETPEKRGSGENGKTQPEPPNLEDTLRSNPELKQAWDDARAYRESFRTPADARTATGALADLARMDALFFSTRPQDHAQLARVVASLDPIAFQSLAKAMSEVANDSARALSEQGASSGERAAAPGTTRTAEPEGPSSAAPGQEEFFHSTNAEVVRAVIESIESQVERLLQGNFEGSAKPPCRRDLPRTG
jgi:hypothetical protein